MGHLPKKPISMSTIKNLLEKVPRRKRIGGNSQNGTEMRAQLRDCYWPEIPQEVASLIVGFAQIKAQKTSNSMLT
jgi:hypothetical protein